ncbi:MAG: XDD3 family exosortase-dependent surface protein [Cyanobacteria bacterium P01_D01_bin.156]
MKQVSSLIGSTLGCLAVAYTAHASTLHQGWTYSIDAFDDGAGGYGYEIKGLATKETQEHIYISVSGESLLTGVSSPDADDGNIGWGDILLNFTGQDMNAVNGSLFGIRFAETNDSGISQIGVFGNVTARSVAEFNSGYESLKQYYQDGWERPNTMGDLATTQDVYGYMGETVPALMSISDGTFLGEIDLLSNQEAVAAGLDFEQFNAADREIHTLRFVRNLLPAGDFIATLLMECANDGIALLGQLSAQANKAQDVPEPSSVIGLLTVSLLASWMHRGRDRESATETHLSNLPGPDESL